MCYRRELLTIQNLPQYKRYIRDHSEILAELEFRQKEWLPYPWMKW